MPTARRLGGRASITSSATITRPSVWRRKPATMRSKVVLPQPEGPKSEISSPPRMSRLMFSTATAPPYRWVMPSSTTDRPSA